MTAPPRRTRRTRRPATTEWLELLAVEGPFLAAPVVTDTWPAGLPALDRLATDALREASTLLTASPGTRDEFVDHVLAEFLDWRGNLASGATVPPALSTPVPEYGTTVHPGFALLRSSGDDALQAVLLGVVVAPGSGTTRRSRTAGRWMPSPADLLAHVLRARAVPLGLVTDGTEWTLVCAQPGGATTTVTFTRHVWFEEPDTLRAFHALLCRLRFFGVPDDATLPALLKASLDRQEEITERLSGQSHAVVEMLVATLGRLDADHLRQHGRPLLPAHVEPTAIYQAAVTVLMRLVFLLYAEERGLLPLDDDTYADTYAASTLATHLRERAGEAGEDALERSCTAWHRLLALSRAVHRGLRHDQLNLQAYGGSLFDPDRFPWLEGRAWAAAPLDDALVPPVDDRTILRALESLQYLRFSGERRRVSFRDLDVEQIGYVYEGLLDQDAVRAEDWVLGVASDAGRESNGPEIPLAELEQRLAAGVPAFAEWLSPLTKQGGHRLTPAAIVKAMRPPSGADAVDAERCVRAACGGDESAVARVLPFAGLLRRDPRDLPVVYPPGSLYLTDSAARADSGAIYTPKALADDVVTRTLEPLVYNPGPLDTEDRAQWRVGTPEEILDLKVVDIAAGSGAFLVAAARYLALRLLEARRNYDPSHGSLREEPLRQELLARREVIDRCIYGVDINPMAVEMAKLSLWLVTLDRSRPFGFLDDRIAVGDSLLGITSPDQLLDLHLAPVAGRRADDDGTLSAFTADVPGLLKEARELRERLVEVELLDARGAQHKAGLLAQAREATAQLTLLADALSAVSLAGGRDEDYAAVATAYGIARTSPDAWDDFAERTAFGLTDPRGAVRRPAHFPLLFPEVFTEGHMGFDAVVGNPPYLGGQKLTGAYGTAYREHLVRAVGDGTRGSADLIAYMLLRAVALLDREHGQVGVIGTNTLAQGDTREVGLDQVTRAGLDLRAAVKSAKWPTRGANLEYCVVWGSRQPRAAGVRADADGILVAGITPSLDPVSRVTGNPHRLAANAGIAFIGSYVLGLGFTMSEEEARALIEADPRNAEVLFPYVNGEDLNSRPDSSGSRWVINFRDWPEERAQGYPGCYAIVLEKVRPQRAGDNRGNYRRYWWRYAEHRPGLYAAIEKLDRVLAIALVSKVALPVFAPTGQVFSHMLGVFASDDAALLALVSSAPHYWWAVGRASSLRTDLRYTPSDVFETLPLPAFTDEMRTAGDRLDRERRALMLDRDLGLTRLYNQVHDRSVTDPGIETIRELHREVDEAVCAAYEWDDLPLAHDHYDTRQGPRYTVSPAARVELVDRLLELNHARYADELARGLHDPRQRRRPDSWRAAEPRPLGLFDLEDGDDA